MNYRSWASWWRLWWGFSSGHCRRRRSIRCPAPPPGWTPPSGAPTRPWDKDPRSGSRAFSEGGNTHTDSQVIKHTSTVNTLRSVHTGRIVHTLRFSLNVVEKKWKGGVEGVVRSLVLSPRIQKIFSFRRWNWEQTIKLSPLNNFSSSWHKTTERYFLW